jgi:hypothetical protein
MTVLQQQRILAATGQPPVTASPLHVALVAENGFRAFGVSASASRADLQTAASSIRRALRLDMVKSTDWDVSWLDTVARSEAALQNATGRLADVERRLIDRLFWFGQNSADLVALAPGTTPPSAVAAVTPERSHDLALLMLLHAAVVDPAFADGSRWLAALAAWQRALGNDAYWNAMLAQDQSGGFEPAANSEDIVALRRRANGLALSLLSDAAKDATAAGNETLVARVTQILREAPLENEVRYELENQIVGPLEEDINRLCKEIGGECWSKTVREENAADKNKPICAAATQRLETEVVPKLGKIERVGGKDSVFATRSRGEVALALSSLAAAWTWADNFVKSEELYKRAHALAAGTPVEGRIKESVKNIKNPAQRQRDRVKPIKRAPPLRTVNTIGTNLYSLGIKYPPNPEWQYATLYFVVLFIPLIPLRRYLVSPAPSGGWYFHATLRFGAVQWIHLLFVLVFGLAFFLGQY